MIKELEEVRSLIDIAHTNEWQEELRDSLTKLDAVISRLKTRQESAMLEVNLPASYQQRQLINTTKGNNND